MNVSQLNFNQVKALEQLKKEMLLDAKLKATELAQSSTQLVFGDGNSKALIMLIGEAPGATEDKTGKPFVGQAGQLLSECLEGLNLSRQDTWITNLVKHRPPANRDPLPAEKDLYAPYLKKEIAIIKPRLIITLGRHAGSYFIHNLKLAQQHGQLQACKILTQNNPPIELMVAPFYHPAAALYNPQLIPIIKQDFLNLKDFLFSNHE